MAQYSGNCPLASFNLLLGLLRLCWVPFRLYHPLLPTAPALFSLTGICRYLTFLAVDWLRTVSGLTPLLGVACLICLSLFPAFLAPFTWVSPLSGIGPVLGVPAPFSLPLVSSFSWYFSYRFVCLRGYWLALLCWLFLFT